MNTPLRKPAALAYAILAYASITGCATGGQNGSISTAAQNSAANTGSTDATVNSRGSTNSPGSTAAHRDDGTAAPATGRVDPALIAAVGEGERVRALVTLGGTGTPTGTPAQKSHGAPTGRGSAVEPAPGPHAGTKGAVLTRAGDGVVLIRDYPQLPVLLVEITNREALDRLTGDPQVISVRRDQANRLGGSGAAPA
jgi:hypothetical protein